MSTEDEEIRALQAKLRAKRQEAQEGDRETLDGAQARLDALRARAGVQRGVRELPWLRVVGALDAHAAKPETADAIARDNARLDAVARHALAGLAKRFELHEHPDLLDVYLDDEPHETAALAAFREVFELRARSARRRPVARVVSGPAGTGKTAAMAWSVLHQRPGLSLREQVAGNVPALFVMAASITSTPRNGFSTNNAAWERWIEAPVLAVDDAGTEPGDPDLLVALFTERWARPSVTLVSTNLPQRDWWPRYTSSRLADRWMTEQKACGFEWFVPVAGKSMRGGR